MNSRYLIFLVFLSGLGAGWYAKTWLEPYQSNFSAGISAVTGAKGNKQSAGSRSDVISAGPSTLSPWSVKPEDSGQAGLDEANAVNQNSSNNNPLSVPQAEASADNASVNITFDQLLDERRYFDAMALFEEQKQQSEQTAIQLKRSLLKELRYLIEAQNNNDFSELIDNLSLIHI